MTMRTKRLLRYEWEGFKWLGQQGAIYADDLSRWFVIPGGTITLFKLKARDGEHHIGDPIVYARVEIVA